MKWRQCIVSAILSAVVTAILLGLLVAMPYIFGLQEEIVKLKIEQQKHQVFFMRGHLLSIMDLPDGEYKRQESHVLYAAIVSEKSADPVTNQEELIAVLSPLEIPEKFSMEEVKEKYSATKIKKVASQ